ncbi:hypothetical protein ACHELX_002165 [Vibrio vulnificus]
MKINGIQYYWIVASGLVLHTILALMTIAYSDQLDEADSATLAIYLIVWVPALICYYTVILEMWSVFRLKLLIVFAPHLYWLWRINGHQGNYT